MDHVISYINDYMKADVEEFIEEWQTGNYKNISDCPHYGAVKAYCTARNVLSKYYYGTAEYSTPMQIVNYFTEGEQK